MSSLGEYASARTIKCNKLIAESIDAPSLKSQIYGSWKLSQSQDAAIQSTAISGWQSVITPNGITLNGGNTFNVSQIGIYNIQVVLQATNVSSIDIADGSITDTLGIDYTGALHETIGGNSHLEDIQLCFSSLVQITNIATGIQVKGFISAAADTPQWNNTYSNISIHKIV